MLLSGRPYHHPNRGPRIVLKIEVEAEEDGRWIAEVIGLPGVLAYGATHEEAIPKAEVLALRVLADRVEHGEHVPEVKAFFAAA
jgi:predicted RNase H-like HicB family nuclease